MSIRPWTQRLLRERITRWQTTFPYHWDADDYVSRRQMLRLAVLSSGALFAATAGIIGLNYARPNRSIASKKAIITAADLPVGKVHYFEYPAAGEQAILLNLPQTGFVAYSGKCTHLSCAVYYREDEKKLICPCHVGIGNIGTAISARFAPQIAQSTGDTSCAWLCHLAFEGSPAVSALVKQAYQYDCLKTFIHSGSNFLMDVHNPAISESPNLTENRRILGFIS
jgi:hypothetical protein